METIQTITLLNRGKQYLGNSPDHLAKRIALAQVLVDSRLVKNLDAGLLAFKIWAEPTASAHPVETILSIANTKAMR